MGIRVDEPIWKLTISLRTTQLVVHGQEEILRPHFERWANEDFVPSKMLIKGHSDSPDRAPVEACFKTEEVECMSLLLAY